MDEAQKARIRLEHWINHNCEHLKGYLEVSNSLDEIGLTRIGDRIRAAVEYMDKANDEFRKALDQLDVGIPGSGCGCHEHSHERSHCHSHERCNDEGSEECHEHSHEHRHSHPHHHDEKCGHRHD